MSMPISVRRRMRLLAEHGTVRLTVRLRGYDDIEVWEATLVRSSRLVAAATAQSASEAIRRLEREVQS